VGCGQIANSPLLFHRPGWRHRNQPWSSRAGRNGSSLGSAGPPAISRASRRPNTMACPGPFPAAQQELPVVSGSRARPGAGRRWCGPPGAGPATGPYPRPPSLGWSPGSGSIVSSDSGRITGSGEPATGRPGSPPGHTAAPRPARPGASGSGHPPCSMGRASTLRSRCGHRVWAPPGCRRQARRIRAGTPGQFPRPHQTTRRQSRITWSAGGHGATPGPGTQVSRGVCSSDRRPPRSRPAAGPGQTSRAGCRVPSSGWYSAPQEGPGPQALEHLVRRPELGRRNRPPPAGAHSVPAAARPASSGPGQRPVRMYCTPLRQSFQLPVQPGVVQFQQAAPGPGGLPPQLLPRPWRNTRAGRPAAGPRAPVRPGAGRSPPAAPHPGPARRSSRASQTPAARRRPPPYHRRSGRGAGGKDRRVLQPEGGRAGSRAWSISR
jgi:hypothetical protein